MLKKSGNLLQLLHQLLHLQPLIVGAVAVAIANQTINVFIYLPSYHRLEKKHKKTYTTSLKCRAPNPYIFITSLSRLSPPSYYLPLYVLPCKYNINNYQNNGSFLQNILP